VVDDQGVVHDRQVTLGPLYEGLRIVQDGLGRDDRIVVSGVQRARPGLAVDAEERAPKEPRAQTAEAKPTPAPTVAGEAAAP
jgi:hypothetical protein